MQNYYQELSLLPQEEININFLWSKAFQQLHLGLVEMQDNQKQIPIGVSFPEYVSGEKFSVLGSKCRLFADDETTLSKLDATKWLSRLSDYVHCTGIRPVPGKLSGYATYRREQPKASQERLARRYAKYRQVDYDTALLHYSHLPFKPITTPFIRLQSLSNGQTFRLWIKKTQVSEPSGSSFSSYGLSAISTVPEF